MMHISTRFIIFMFVIFAAVLLVSDSIYTAVSLLSVMTNFVMLSGEIDRRTQSQQTAVQSPRLAANVAEIEAGRPFEMKTDIGSSCTTDAEALRINQARTRDKTTIESITARDASHFAKNFGNEFEETERKQWWGNLEY